MNDLGDLADASIPDQLGGLEEILLASTAVSTALCRAPELNLPNWYLGAGAVTQTVWNHLHGFEPLHGVKDFDIVYFNPEESVEAGQRTAERVAEALADLEVKVDVTNEAQVHRWYPERFGRTIPPYRSTEHAIGTWPSTASSIGVRLDQTMTVCAPFGLHDLFAMTARPNKTLIDEQVYQAKVDRWARLWPRLRVEPW